MNISKKSGYLSKLQNADKFTIFCTAAVSFLVAATVIVVLFFGYVSNNKINARMLLYETAKQKAQALKDVIDIEMSYLESLSDSGISDNNRNYALVESVSVKKNEEQTSAPEKISVSENAKLELCIPNENLKAENGEYICAQISTQKLSDFVDNGSFNGNSSVILYEVHSGNIVVNTAEKHGFEGNKIGFLSDFEYPRSFSANKMFSDIEDKKSGYTQIKLQDEIFEVLYVDV